MSRNKAKSIAAYLVTEPPLRLPLKILSIEVPAICNKTIITFKCTVSLPETLKDVSFRTFIYPQL